MRNFNCNTVVGLLLVILSWQAKSVTSSCSFPNQDTFLSYFPCTHVDNLTSVEECDIFTYTAARLAVKRFRQVSSNPVSFISFTQALVAIPTGKDGDLDVEEVIFQSAQHLADHNTLGIVGPAHPELANRIAPLASDKLGILQVSYSSTDVDVDSPRGSTYYRDLPTDLFVNEARLTLLNEFQWHKVGILTREELSFALAAESFYGVFDSGHHNIEIAFSSTFQTPESADPALQEMARMRLRIMMGLFGPSDARRVLCRAHGYGLTTSEHAWILPSFYNPNWWKLDNTELAGLPKAERCSNDEMIDILNSTLFVDPVKFPLLQPDDMELNISKFYKQLIVVTKKLFPSLGDTDLTPFLLHSRATRAFEAVWLMALAWVDVLTNNRSCDTMEALRDSIEGIIFCEWCNVYSACLNNKQLREGCSFCVTATFAESDRVMDYYGQILVSQFIDGVHCPIGFYWPASLENNINNGKLEFVRLADLESSSHCLHKLQLDASILNYTSGCPSDFWWKGRSSPPSGVFPLTYSDIGFHGLVLICLLIVIELVYAIALLVGNIAWRSNKHIKASSARLNIVIIVAFILKLPSPLMDAIVISSNRLTSSSSANVLCQLLPWFFILPVILIFGTLLVKNWRVYCIFHNKQLKGDTSWWLSDKVLLVLIIFLAIPVVVILLVWSVIDPPEVTNHTIDDNTAIVTTCGSKHLDIWFGTLPVYVIIILLILLFFGYQNTKVCSRFSEKEGETSQKALMFLLVFAVVRIILAFYLLAQPSLYLVTFWTLVQGDSLLEGVLLAILFIPLFVRVYKDHVRSSEDTVRKKESERYLEEYEASREEIQELRKQLTEMEKKKQILISRGLDGQILAPVASVD